MLEVAASSSKGQHHGEAAVDDLCMHTMQVSCLQSTSHTPGLWAAALTAM